MVKTINNDKTPIGFKTIKGLIISIKSLFFTLYFFFILGIPFHGPISIINLYNFFNNKEFSTIFFVAFLFLFTFGIHDFFDQIEKFFLNLFLIKNPLILKTSTKIEQIRIENNIDTSDKHYFVFNHQDNRKNKSNQIRLIKLLILIVWIIFGTIFSILLSLNFNLVIKEQNEYVLLFLGMFIFSFLYFGDIIPHGKKL